MIGSVSMDVQMNYRSSCRQRTVSVTATYDGAATYQITDYVMMVYKISASIA